MSEMNQEFEIDLRDIFRLIWREKWMIIGLFVVAVVSTFFLTKMMTPLYQTSATLLIQRSDTGGLQGLLGGDMFTTGRDRANTYSRMLKTRSVLEEVIHRIDLRNEEGEYILAGTLGSMISVSAINGTDLVEISMQHPNPKKAVEILDTLIDVFMKLNIEMNKSALTGAREFTERQKEEVERQLKFAEEQLLAYKHHNNVIIPTEEAKQALARLVEVERLKSMIDVELGSIDASIRRLQHELAYQSESVISSIVTSNNPMIRQYRAQIVELENQLLTVKMKYTDNHPEVVSLESRLNNILDALSKEVEKEISSQTETINPVYQSLFQNLVNLEVNWLAQQAKLEGLERLIAEYEENLKKFPVKELDLLRLERNAKVTSDIYTMLLTKTEELKISEAMQTSNIFVVDSAFLPRNPSKPNKKMMLLLAGFMAIVCGVGLALFMEFMDTTVKTADELEKMLNLPVIGTIPDIKKMKKVHK